MVDRSVAKFALAIRQTPRYAFLEIAMPCPTGTFTARWLVPVCQRPICGGWLRVEQGKVVALEASSPPGDCIDLGDVAVLPGLVNCHTHLEFSDLPSPLGEPGGALPAWVATVVRHRLAQATDSPSVIAQRRASAIVAGCAESTAAGVRLLGEIATLPWLEGDAATAATAEELRIIAFAETLGLRSERANQTFQAAEDWIRQSMSRRSLGRNISFGYSPHAPYSTSLELVDRCVSQACRFRLPLAMHLAESREELQLLDEGRGPFREVLESLGAWQADAFPQPGGVGECLKRLARAPRCLVVHGNYLTDDQITFLATQPQMSVIFCPRTHAFFQHDPYPLSRLLEAGVRVGLGTDSRASNPDLKLWEEVRHVLATVPAVTVESVLKMATLWGADALGQSDCGRLAVGARPGLWTLPTSATDETELWQAIANATAPCPLG